MTMKKANLKLVIDNDANSQLKLLNRKQKQYIDGKLKLQEERKLVNKLLKQYEDIIIKTENKIQQLKRKVENVKSRAREVRNLGANRNQD